MILPETKFQIRFNFPRTRFSPDIIDRCNTATPQHHILLSLDGENDSDKAQVSDLRIIHNTNGELMCTRFSNICTVTIFVGSEKTRFDVHQDQLYEVSPFLKAAFTSQYKKSSTKSIDLPEADVDTVDLFVQWLYKQQCNLWSVPADDRGEHLMQPIRLLLFADKYDIPSLKLYTIGELLVYMRKSGEYPFGGVIEYVYKKTYEGSRLRMLMLDWCARSNCWVETKCARAWLISNPGIAVDLIVALSLDADPPRDIGAKYYMSDSELSGDESTG